MAPRFLVPAKMAPGSDVALPDSVAHHARRVLRLRAGDEIVLFDGAGREYRAILGAPAGNETCSQARIVSGGPVDREARVAITLVQALCAAERLDWLMEKCVELGAARLVVAPAARSVARLDAARRARREARSREIVAAACAQCGRNRLPAVEFAADLAAGLAAGRSAQRRWVLDPLAPRGIQAGDATSAAIVVGPEGGLTDEELRLAEAMGFERARLGKRVLRTETAGIAAIAAVLAQAGEL